MKTPLGMVNCLKEQWDKISDECRESQETHDQLNEELIVSHIYIFPFGNIWSFLDFLFPIGIISLMEFYQPQKIIVRSATDAGAVIRELRKKKGLTQAQAASLCNVGVRFFSELENGKPNLQLNRVLKVVQNFGLN